MKLILGDWLTNAGIVGYLRIIQRIQQTEKFDMSNDFIEINPENDLKFFADAYCSSVLVRVVEDLFLRHPFHYKIKVGKKNDALDNLLTFKTHQTRERYFQNDTALG